MPWGPCVTQPLLTGCVSSVPASQARTCKWAQGAVEINFKELTPLPHPTNPYSLCEIYLRVIPSEGWVSRRPGAPELRWGASCRGSLLPTMNPPLHCKPPPGLSPGQVAVDAIVSACTVLIQIFQAPHLLTPLPSLVQGSEGVCWAGKGPRTPETCHCTLSVPQRGDMGKGAWRGEGGPVLSEQVESPNKT